MRSYVRRKLNFYPADTCEEIAEDCDCSPQMIGRICNNALEKFRVRLAERGVSRAEALMFIEFMSQGDSYHCSLDEEVVSPEGR